MPGSLSLLRSFASLDHCPLTYQLAVDFQALKDSYSDILTVLAKTLIGEMFSRLSSTAVDLPELTLSCSSFDFGDSRNSNVSECKFKINMT